MFSGKSEELIRRLKRATYADQNVLIVKPVKDTRTEKKVASRRKNDKSERGFEESDSFPAHEINSAQELADLIAQHRPDVLAIDEAQFFEEWLPEQIHELLGKRGNSIFTIIISGLDMDHRTKPYGIMPQLMAMADEVIKLTAVCFACKKRPANLTCKTGGSSDKQTEIGSKIYEARCRICHKLPE